MPYMSGRLLWVSQKRPHGLTDSSIKGTIKSHSVKAAWKPKTPSRPNASQPAQPHSSHGQSKGPRVAQDTSGQPVSYLLGQARKVRDYFRSVKSTHIRRILIAVPILYLAGLHRPYDVMSVTGISMSPCLKYDPLAYPPIRESILVRLLHSTKSASNRNKSGTRSEAEFPSEFQRGQVVVFDSPTKIDRTSVKRIVALPGDIVLPLSGYIGGDEPVVIPWNHVWVEGDVGSKKDSMDSNYYGPISQALITGEVVAVWHSWTKWDWLNWREHSWPAREAGRVEEDAVTSARMDPNTVQYNDGWRDGSIAHILERIRTYPDQVLFTFVNDHKSRQETRRLYNNALYVVEVATSEDEKQLAQNVRDEMESVYGREALAFGIRKRKQVRDRGELPDAATLKVGQTLAKDKSASDAEAWLNTQGWQLDRHSNGAVKLHVQTD